jgi:hypothetical protein
VVAGVVRREGVARGWGVMQSLLPPLLTTHNTHARPRLLLAKPNQPTPRTRQPRQRSCHQTCRMVLRALLAMRSACMITSSSRCVGVGGWVGGRTVQCIQASKGALSRETLAAASAIHALIHPVNTHSQCTHTLNARTLSMRARRRALARRVTLLQRSTGGRPSFTPAAHTASWRR